MKSVRTTRSSRIGVRTRQAVIDFFDRNVNEWLTVEDAAEKFGVSEITAQNYLGALTGEGSIERISVYRKKRS